MFNILLILYYRLKIKFLKQFLGSEAIETVLYGSLFPRVVLDLGGAAVGRNVRVGRCLTIHESGGSFKALTIGDDVHLGKFVFIDLTQPVSIGHRVTIAMYSKILSHQNLGDSRLKQLYPPISGPVSIPDDVVLGADTTLLYPTRLASGTLVAAGAVVRGTHDKPCILMANRAQVVRELGVDV